MKITVIGTGYVGLVAGVCFADAGHQVICVDKDEAKVKLMKQGQSPIFEPGLEELMQQAIEKARVDFTTDLQSSITASEVIFIAVGTPEGPQGEPDMSAVMAVVDSICKVAQSKKFVVLKSTVPVGTAQQLQRYFNEHAKYSIEVINNPEFLKEGAALDDFLRPDRVVIGCRSSEARSIMQEIYDPFVKNGHPILFMDNVSAELTKYAANSFLSIKISFINELAQLADKVGADINEVRRGFTSDKRINPAFFYPGVGYGGSCFPKDVKALVKTGEKHNLDMSLVRTADEINIRQRTLMFEKLKNHFKDLKAKQIAIWGLSFKPRTDDVREAPALILIELLSKAGATVRAYDPIASENARKACRVPFEVVDEPMKAIRGADALVIMTEWNEFRNPDFDQIKKELKTAVLFDGRNIFEPAKIKKHGFQYYCFGRENIIHE